MAFRNYDPANVIITFKGTQILGYANGTFVKASRNEETFKSSVGAGGDVVRTRNRNKMGTVVITLQAASSYNDLLATYAAADEETGTGTGSIQIKDLAGTMLVFAEIAWVQKPADIERGAEASDTEWTLECAEITTFAGGQLA